MSNDVDRAPLRVCSNNSNSAKEVSRLSMTALRYRAAVPGKATTAHCPSLRLAGAVVRLVGWDQRAKRAQAHRSEPCFIRVKEDGGPAAATREARVPASLSHPT